MKYRPINGVLLGRGRGIKPINNDQILANEMENLDVNVDIAPQPKNKHVNQVKCAKILPNGHVAETPNPILKKVVVKKKKPISFI